MLFVEATKVFARLRKLKKQWTDFPPCPEVMFEACNGFDDALQTNRIRVEHGATPPAGKTIPVHINDIDI